MATDDTNADAQTRALTALAWILTDEVRTERLLATTGLDPAGLRARATEPALLAAVLGFLEAHEPDLLACAAAIGIPAVALVGARAELEQ